MAVYYSIKCPHCKSVVESGKDRRTRYGSPFRKCRHCCKWYFDTNYIEVGLLTEQEINKVSIAWGNIALIVIGLIFLYYGIAESYSVGLIMGIGMTLFGAIAVISQLKYNPKDDASLQREIRESKKRLTNPHYVIALWKAGCNITPELLVWAKDAVATEEIEVKEDNKI